MLYPPRPVRKARRRPAAQSGFTIVELSVAVAIAGVLLVAAIALVQVVLRQTRTNDLVSSIPRTLTQIDKMYARATNFGTLDTQIAIGFGAFDGAFDITGPANARVATHRFGYRTLARRATSFRSADDGAAYAVMYAGIPRAACADVVTSAAASGVLGLIVAPETGVVGTPAFGEAQAEGLTIGMFDATRAVPPAGIRVKGTERNGALDVEGMAGSNACGTNSDTVTIAMVNWK
ncbi:MAG TPA: prepilin-type N-terminal cleavage/methylation domain-containing protein [Herbaspirillum sp.]|uniref:PulJ/GspJ family protein n=1 Tax=Herbaspirillum sp. TaxID=1890675 RepID=UPI002D689784|nr:prepilin-type N-terminal cleavage/methylation domain-containing protein [Herbaspirillum sp.]HZG22727.1 prepilin-type N-terminal cleavage/methylation domain-containing protein [Herbaspirillum sp.]